MFQFNLYSQLAFRHFSFLRQKPFLLPLVMVLLEYPLSCDFLQIEKKENFKSGFKRNLRSLKLNPLRYSCSMSSKTCTISMPQKVVEISPSVTKDTGWVHWRYCLFNNPKFPGDKELRLVMEDFSIILKLHLLIYFFFFSWLTIKDF